MRRPLALACSLVLAASCLAVPAYADTPADASAADQAQQAAPSYPVRQVADGGYLMLYRDLAFQLDAPLKKPTWKSSNSLIAKVTSDGIVTGGQVGACTLTATKGKKTVKVKVETTYRNAYLAVQNAYADFNTKLKYSQGRRMAKKYRDCSSYVGRCYWDASLGRKLVVIGPSYAKTNSLPADGQARWLGQKGKRVSYKKVKTSQLLPGDTVYVRSQYAGGGGWRGINHASIYVGNGKLLDGTGTGGKGTVGFRSYKKSKIRFIGRPCAELELNKASVKLTAAAGAMHATTLKARFAPGKVRWKSSNPSVATVFKGKVTAVSAGTAVITATSKGQSYKCKVKVA